MNPYIKNLLAFIGAIPVLLAPAYPHAVWLAPLSAGIAVMLGIFHVTPLTLPGTSTTAPGAGSPSTTDHASTGT